MKDRGIVIFGKVEQGTVNMGEKITIMPSNQACQVLNVYNSKGEAVRYAKPGENVQLRLSNISDENSINKGDVLCNRETPMPISDLFEAEVEVLELLDYKPILSKGYQCILHIHTVADDCVIKEILVAWEKNDRGEITEKIKPQFTKSYSKITCRIQTRIPICLEKYESSGILGRFTLRDEGKTIALGKILKYKPAKVQTTAAPIQGTAQVTTTIEETKKPT
jgi:peptide chain release factor subunit 3